MLLACRGSVPLFSSWLGLCPATKIRAGKVSARMVFFVRTCGEAFVDQGKSCYEAQQRERSVAALKRHAAALGFCINPWRQPHEYGLRRFFSLRAQIRSSAT